MSSELNRYLKNIKRQDKIITHRLDQWLVEQGGEFILTEEEVEVLARLLSTPRGSRASLFTGSQAGTCERKQVLNFLNVPQIGRVNPRLMNIFMDGTWRHCRWQLMLPRAIPGTTVEIRVDQPSMRLRGSVDAAHIDERWGLELKGTSMFSEVVKNGVMPSHELQAVRYWLATDEDPDWGDKPLTKWIYVYEDKRSQEWAEIIVERSTALEKKVVAELSRLNRAVDHRQLPDVLKECVHGKGPAFRDCGHSATCLGFDTWEEAQDAGAPVAIGRRKLSHH